MVASWPLARVISGGQTGADQAGLCAAVSMGYETGGWMPRGWRTESGPAPDLARLFGMREAPSADYAVRTLMNVREADGTVIFGDVESSGTALTIRLCAVYKGLDKFLTNPTPDQLRAWIARAEIRTLNVAGNRLSKRPTIFDEVVEVLGVALAREDRPTCTVAPIVLRPAGRVRR